MDSKGIFEALQAKFGEDAVFGYEPPKLPTLDDYFFIDPNRLLDVVSHLRDDPKLDFDSLECLSGVDYLDAPPTRASTDESEELEKGTLHVVYHLRSYQHKHRVVLKVSLPRSNPRLTTISTVWSAANWQERECYDLLGVLFEGHPDLRRIMLPEDWVGHPLRKDYKEEAFYQGIPTTRPNPLDLLQVIKKPDKAAKTDAKPAKTDAKPAKADKPEAKADKPEAKADKPEAKADKPEAKADKPEAKADKPEAKDKDAGQDKS